MKLIRLQEHNRNDFISCLIDYTRAYYKEFVLPEEFTYVREIHDEDEIVGYVSYTEMPTLFEQSIFVDFIFIKENFRGQGHFQRVIEMISRLFPFFSVFSKVRRNNASSIKAHEKHTLLNDEFLFFSKKSNIS